MSAAFAAKPLVVVKSIFAERFANGAVALWARRTGRLDSLVHHLGLALGGRPGASLARRLMLPVSNDTLLRVAFAAAVSGDSLNQCAR